MVYFRAPQRDRVHDDQLEDSDAFRTLASPEGPVRFARVDRTVFRGGQPDRRHLELLHELGVRTIVNLRRENRDASRAEAAHARSLGMRFLHYPFYGVFGAEEEFLVGIEAEIRAGDVYVHCKHGRDRTSLLIALYRVMEAGWAPDVAWKLEAIDYGSAQTYFYRKLRVVFDRMATKYFKHTLPPVTVDAIEAIEAPVDADTPSTPALPEDPG